MRFSILAAVSALLLSACAVSHEPGWTGENAAPFDSAKARCEIETQTVEGPDFERCMANLGWRRLPEDRDQKPVRRSRPARIDAPYIGATVTLCLWISSVGQ